MHKEHKGIEAESKANALTRFKIARKLERKYKCEDIYTLERAVKVLLSYSAKVAFKF